MKRTAQVLSAVLVVLVAMVSVADAGWLIVGDDGEETIISQGRMKSTWDDGAMLFIAEGDMIHVINDQKKMVASGTVDEFCTEMNAMIEKALEQVPEEQRAMMRKMMGGGDPPEVKIEEKGSGGEVSGFATTRYDVMSDGELYEELWITKDKELVADCQPVMMMLGRFLACMAKISAMGSEPMAEASPEYAKVFELGAPVKSVRHAKGGQRPDFTEITKSETPEGAFNLPSGYKAVSFASFWGM